MTSPMHSPLQSPLQPVMRSPLEFRRRGGFDPESLFRNGEVGVYYDPSDLGTLYQDSAGTTPVTAAGQPVGLMLDKSGNGNHASQATAGKRPILQESGGKYSLKFDGVDDFMSTGNIDFSGTDKISAWVGMTVNAASSESIFELSTDFNSNNGAFLFYRGSLGNEALNLSVKTADGYITAATAYTVYPRTAVLTAGIDAALLSGQVAIAIDGVAGPITGATSSPLTAFGNYPLYIASRAGTSLLFSGNLYPLVIAGALYDANTVAKMNQYVAKKTGVTL